MDQWYGPLSKKGEGQGIHEQPVLLVIGSMVNSIVRAGSVEAQRAGEMAKLICCCEDDRVNHRFRSE